MAKKKLTNYIFQTGIPKSGNNYPIAHNLISKNVEWIKDEMMGYILEKTNLHTKADIYPNTSNRITNNRTFIKDEVWAWVSAQVAGNIAPFAGFTKTEDTVEADVEKVVDAIARDVRYGGNENLRTQTGTYFIDGVLQLANSGDPEIAYWTYMQTLIKDYILPGSAFSSLQTSTSYTPTGAIYTPTTGDMILTIGAHTLTVGQSVRISTLGLTFTCAKDNNATNHSYPRASGSNAPGGADYFYNKPVKITAIDSVSITVNVGVSSNTSAHTFVSASSGSVQSGTIQDLTGTNAESAGVTDYDTKLGQLINTVDNGYLQLPALISSSYKFENFTYNTDKCNRDYQFILDAYLNDLRYNGNKQTRFIASKFWVGTTPQIDGDRQPEIAATNWVRDLITNYVLANRSVNFTPTNAVYTPTTGVMTLTIGTHPITVGQYIRINTNSLTFTCAMDNHGSNHTYPRASGSNAPGGADYAYNEPVLVTGISADSITVNVGISSNTTAHTFVSATTGAVTRSKQSPVVTTQFTDGTLSESNAASRITTLSNIVADVKENGLDNLPTLEKNEVSSLKVVNPGGQVNHEDILLITNTTRNTVLYNFADASLGCTVEYEKEVDDDFKAFLQGSDTVTTIFLNADTSTHALDDAVSIFVEGGELKTRPFDFGTDAIERFRIAKPQSMIDADFEYGLQPTKWQAIATQRGYPSIYEVPGTDIDIASVTTDASTGTAGIGASLITVTTVGPHSMLAGDPLTIIGFAGSGVEGAGRAQGSFVVNAITSNKIFNYYAKAKVGTSNAQVISTKFTQMRKGAFYTGADLGEPTFSVVTQGSSGSVATSLKVLSGQTIVPFTGTAPPTGAPVAGTGIATGTQITAITGSGGAIVSPKIKGDYASGVTQVEVVDAAGILQNSVMDRGDGFGTNIINVNGMVLTLSSPLQSSLIGDQTVYQNVAGLNRSPNGSGATWNVSWTGGTYTVAISVTGLNYQVGDAITILGTALSASTPANDLTINIDSVDTAGEILSFSYSGTAFDGTGSVSNVTGSVPGGVGTGGTFNITKTAGTYSVALASKTYTAITPAYAGGNGAGSIWDITILNNTFSAVTMSNGGTGFIVNDSLRFAGTEFGGVGDTNELLIRVTGESSGVITGHSSAGTAPDAVVTYSNPAFTTSGSGTLAQFNVTRTGTTYSAVITGLGTNYAQNDTITIDGGNLGGASTTNDCTLTIATVDGSGGITSVTETGTAVNTQSWTGLTSANNYVGSGVQFSVTNPGGGSYSNITVTTVGEHYTLGQELKISGTTLGGLSPTHDLTITLDTALGANDSVAQGNWTTSGNAVPGPESLAYVVNDMLEVSGSALGGVNTTNDAYVRVSSVDADGSITGLAVSGTGTDGDVTYTEIPEWDGSTIPGWTTNQSGTGATFTIQRVGTAYTATVVAAGSGFVGTEQITILGTHLGGATAANDASFTISTVDGSGGITAISAVTGTAANTQTYTNSPTSKRIGQGEAFDISISGGNYTVDAIAQAGTNFWVGQIVKISGSTLYGASPGNDLSLEITSIDAVSTGGITGVTATGSANTGTGAVGTLISGSNRPQAGIGAVFYITRSYTNDSSTTYTEATVSSLGTGYNVGDQIVVSGSSLGGGTPTHDCSITVQAVNSFGGITQCTHSGSAVTGTGVSVYSSITLSDATTQVLPSSSTITYSAIATIQVQFLTPHGLVPGDGFLVTIGSDNGSNNHLLASGPFLVTELPATNQLRFQARAPGQITDQDWSGFVYVRPDSFFVHRPFDGGVQLGTGGPQHGAQAIRQSKKYIRYQSGKGILYTTGALFAPSYDILNNVAEGKALGSVISVTTDEVDHGLQVGAIITLIGIAQQEFNDDYTVTQIVNERTFKITAQSTLSMLTPEFKDQPQVSLKNWNGATVRSGIFDDQNGIFWEYDGVNLNLVQRTATRQLAGTISVNPDSNTITGTGTRFREQLKAGDRIVIRGMTHVVSSVTDNITMNVTPDYRGVNVSSGVKSCLVFDKKVKQDNWNLDRVDGTGPSGYNLNVSKMQMIGLQMSWYGAGFIDYMTRGGDGNFIFCHRMRNSNINTEAYMRTGNQPVRYEVTNEGPNGKLSDNLTAGDTTIRLVDASFFPPGGGTLYIDNEIITYTTITGNKLTGVTRATQLTNFSAGATRSYTAGVAAEHFRNTGVVLISNSASPIISHWGSSYITDGDFDEERGYLFSYSATNLELSTTKKTVFLIRLAPSVANALTGDLGDRDLLNRAQLLLEGIEITTEPESTNPGSLVVQGVINPQNYPIDPSDIGWTGLSGTAQGGQPSFAQIAAGGSVNWNGGETQVTATADTSAAISTQVTNNWWNMGTWYNNYSYWLKEDGPGNNNGFDDRNIKVGDAVSGGSFPANTIITELYEYSYYFLAYYSNNHGGIPMGTPITFSMGGTLTNTNYLYMDPTSWEASNATQGTELQDANFPAGTSVISVDPLARYGPVSGGTNYYKVTFSQTSTGAIAAGASVTFLFGNPPYAQPGETIFSFVAQPGERATLSLAPIKELTNTTLGGRGTFPNGPDALAINVYRTSGAGSVNGTVTLRWSEAQA